MQLDRPPLETYQLLGKIERRQKNYTQSITLLTHYLSQKPQDSSTWYLLAGAYRGAGNTARMQEAIKRYKQTSIDARQRARAQLENDEETATEQQLR